MKWECIGCPMGCEVKVKRKNRDPKLCVVDPDWCTARWVRVSEPRLWGKFWNDTPDECMYGELVNIADDGHPYHTYYDGYMYKGYVHFEPMEKPEELK